MDQRIVVLGGGTAGWMAACLFAHHWPRAAVTVIESPDIGIVGVGEGSTPQLRAFFAKLGIAEADWMPACNATYKTGIEFRGWSDGPVTTAISTPSRAELDVHTQPQFHHHTLARRRGADVPAHPDGFFLNTAHRRAPRSRRSRRRISRSTSAMAIISTRIWSARSCGPRRDARGRRICLAASSRWASMTATSRISSPTTATLIAGDLFIDCSGFASVIAQDALGVRVPAVRREPVQR